MKEYIEKSKAIMYAQDYVSDNEKNVLLRRLYDEPAADVKPVARGEWIEAQEISFDNVYACSACGNEFVLESGTPEDNEYNFCPNCGADMRKETRNG